MQNVVLGIDLGTTYSAVAYVDEFGKARIVPNGQNERVTPSVVFFEEEGSVLVGQNAKDETELSPENVVSFVKREMGKNKEEVRAEENDGIPIPYTYYGNTYSPEAISAFVLKQLKSDAENYLHINEIHRAIITVPAYFNDFERKATIRAGEMAGLDVLQVINEPTAAAISYGINRDENSRTLVFDLGGGTFDVTIIEVVNGEINVLASDGDHRLGGKDWDDRIISYLASEFIGMYGEDPREEIESLAELRMKSERIKNQLSEKTESRLVIRNSGHTHKTTLTRETFEHISEDLLSRIDGMCQSVLAQKDLEWSDISEIVLAGGATRMPMVKELLEKISGKAISASLVNPDECVAMGAALHGTFLDQKKQGLRNPAFDKIRPINDAASHSLGFVTLKEGRLHNSMMIQKNTLIPCKRVKTDFTTTYDNQETLEIIVLQGEATNPENCTLLEGYEFYDLPKGMAGQNRIEVSFEYNTSSVVEVNASLNGSLLPYKRIEPALPHLNRHTDLTRLNLILAVDLSGSMDGRPLDEAINAAGQFIEEINSENTFVGLILFANKVLINQDVTNDRNTLHQKIKGWYEIYDSGEIGYGTSAEPFEQARALMQFTEGRKKIIVLTDGHWKHPEKAIEKARQCAEENIRIKAIGFGNADYEFLSRIATSDEDALFLSDSSQLKTTLLNIATEISTNKIK